MKFVLILLILALAGGAYYEFQLEQSNAVAFRQQIKDLDSRLAAAKKKNEDLRADEADSEKTLAQTQSEAADLNKQVQAVQSQAEANKHASTPAAPSAAASTSPVRGPG